MMSNDERCILGYLISCIYEYTRLYNSAFIPLDTEEWKDTYCGMGCSSISEEEIEQKYKDVLRIAQDNFSSYTFDLHYSDNQQTGDPVQNKVFLQYNRNIPAK